MLMGIYRYLFLRKISSRPCVAVDLPRVGKGEVIPENTNSGTKLKAEKIACRWASLLAV